MIHFRFFDAHRYRAIIYHNVCAHHCSPFLHDSVHALIDSPIVEFFGIFDDSELLSFCCTTPRLWNFYGCIVTGYSIGLVTTLPAYRKRGYASRLINSLNEFVADHRGASFTYLQGIDSFYTQLGYVGFAPKRKYTIDFSHLPNSSVAVRLAADKDVALLKSLYDDYSRSLGSYTIRDDFLWSNLVGQLSSTFLFYSPRIVEDPSGKPFGYFCTSPDCPTTLREFVPSLRRHSVDYLLSGISLTEPFSRSPMIEIFAPFHGPVLECTSTRIKADFSCFLRPSSSNMYKWLSNSRPPRFDTHSLFIFQADNL